MDVLHQSQLLSKEIYALIYGREAPVSLRGSIAGGSYDAVHEHHRSVVLLVEYQLIGSAFVLVRPMFEGCINGLWATYLATDDHLEQFMNGRLTVKPVRELNRLKKKDDGELTETLQRIYTEAWEHMSSYVHGSYVQIARRNAVEYIGSNYPPEEIGDMLRLADSMAILAAMEILSLSKDQSFVEEQMKKVINKYRGGHD
nr:hypothetical protein [Nitrospirota bacterium]